MDEYAIHYSPSLRLDEPVGKNHVNIRNENLI